MRQIERYYVALKTKTGVIAKIITGDFDKGIQTLITEHKKGDVTEIIRVEALPITQKCIITKEDF